MAVIVNGRKSTRHSPKHVRHFPARDWWKDHPNTTGEEVRERFGIVRQRVSELRAELGMPRLRARRKQEGRERWEG